jgi:hypothetical protein
MKIFSENSISLVIGRQKWEYTFLITALLFHVTIFLNNVNIFASSKKPSYLCTMKKEIIKIIIKVVLYALGLIAAYFGVTSLTSCSTSHNVVASGRTTIVSVDTTIVKHSGIVRSKNYKPYGEN